jgi:aminotransferase
LGFLTGPDEFVGQALKIQDSSVICATHAAQHALTETLRDQEGLERFVAEKRSILKARRGALLEPLLQDDRLSVVIPTGACFAFVGLAGDLRTQRTDGAGDQSSSRAASFAHALVEERGVVVVPGSAFGSAWGDFVRLSFGSGTETELRQAAEQLVAFLNTYQG